MFIVATLGQCRRSGISALRNIDFSSWQSVLVTLIGLALFTLISIGIRLLMMFTIQQRRERMNRQINERLRTLIAAYKTLGGSFTGNLAVDPSHRRDVLRAEQPESDTAVDLSPERIEGSDRARRIRDAVEACLSDILLLGTEEQVRLAERAIRDMVAGRPVHTHDLVVSLRNFIREALDLAPIPSDLTIPQQGPTRPSASGARGKNDRANEAGGGKGGGGTGGGGMGGGSGGSAGGGIGTDAADDQPASGRRS